RRRCFAVEHDVEMRVERRHLIDLDEGELHLMRQRRQMPRVEAAILVLDEMQELDQQIALARPVAEQRLDVVERLGLDLAPPGQAATPAPPGAGMDATLCF